jgi:hypothetical protein
MYSMVLYDAFMVLHLLVNHFSSIFTRRPPSLPNRRLMKPHHNFTKSHMFHVHHTYVLYCFCLSFFNVDYIKPPFPIQGAIFFKNLTLRVFFPLIYEASSQPIICHKFQHLFQFLVTAYTT